MAARLAMGGAVRVSNSFSKTTSVSWIERIKQSVIGVLIGFVLVVGAVVLLFWNEGRAVTTARSLAEGAGAVVSVSSDAVDPANEGRLVHASGRLSTQEMVQDDDFGVEAEGVRLSRMVEMYQWREKTSKDTRKKLGGGEETVTTYSYATEWSSRPLESSEFEQAEGHENPPMEFESDTFQVRQAQLGAFTLGRAVLDEIGGGRAMKIPSASLSDIEAVYEGSQRLSIDDGAIYLGDNPRKPAVGDYRIRYDLVPLDTVSVAGRQAGSGFAPYRTTAGDELLLVENGTASASEMFAHAARDNNLLGWIIRAAGLFLLAVGFTMVMEPIGVIADVVPLMGDIVRLGTGLAALVFTVLVGGGVIAIAWFYYRPVVAICVLAGCAALAFALVRYRKGRAGARPGPSVPDPMPAP